jgi:ABC-type transport system involved in multi-copper enzyme maturation permease subunit
MISPTIRALVAKELRQLSRSKGALASATLLPLLLLVIVPVSQLLALRATDATVSVPDVAPLPGLADAGDTSAIFLRLLFPLFVTLGGLVAPSVAAVYMVVAERERRTLELLMALPARVDDILTAKLLAMLLLAVGVTLPLFLIDAAALLWTGMAGPGYVATLLGVLLAALACSIGLALLLALLARDFRTANNLSGALLGPLIVLTAFTLIGVPGEWRFVALIALLLLTAALALIVARRWLTFERYLD